MLNRYTRRIIGQCAAELYDAGNVKESFELLARLTASVEAGAWDGALEETWRGLVAAGAACTRCRIPNAARLYAND